MKLKHYIATSFIIVLLIVLSLAWNHHAQNHIQNIVLISVDTCRADHLSCYGYPRKTTPNIDAIAKDGVLFENVISAVPITLPSHSTMFTGTIPAYHGVHDNSLYKLALSNKTLAEILKDNDFNTAAVISAFVMNSRYGIDQGFDLYDDSFEKSMGIGDMNQRRAQETTEHAVSWLREKSQKPFFLFLHYFDPHETYDPPDPFRSLYINELYAGEIAYTDHYIGKVIDELKRLDIYDSTIVIITSDHGESRGEHGEYTHGYLIYQSTVRVPLIIKAPNAEKGSRIADRVGLIDIVPTICSLFEIEYSDHQGADLSGYLFDSGVTSNERSYYCESLMPTIYGCSPLLGVVTNQWKYIQSPRPELYDLIVDSNEKTNLADSQQQRCMILQDRLKQIVQVYLKKDQSDNRMKPDFKTKMQLASLGYVSSEKLNESFEFDQSSPDAKDFVEFYQLDSQANSLVASDQNDKAEIIYEKMKKLLPDYPGTYRYLGDIALKRQDYQKAIKNYSKYLSKDPDDSSVINDLGVVYGRIGDIDKAQESFKRTLQIDPDNAEAYYNLGDISLIKKMHDESIKNYRQSLQIEPDNFQAHNKIAQVLLKTNRLDEAHGHFIAALELDPSDISVHGNLGMTCFKLGKFEKAVEYCTNFLRVRPEVIEIRLFLSHSFTSLKRTQLAVQEYYKVLDRAPNNIEALNTIAWLSATSKDVKVRNPSDALVFAKKICEVTEYNNVLLLDTLAAVYADVGDFEQAVATIQKAISLIEPTGNNVRTAKLKKRLELYKNQQPLRMP